MIDPEQIHMTPEQERLYKDVYDLLTPIIKPNSSESVMMGAGTLLAIAIQLYCCIFKSDEEVSSILQEASNSLPELRVQIEERIKEKTIH